MADDRRSRLMPALRMMCVCLPLLAGCAQMAQPPGGGWATLPGDAVAGAGDPTRAAILKTAAAFGNPTSLAGDPAGAARAVANYIYLAVEIPNGPRWRGWNPQAGMALMAGAPEVRAAFGIAQDAPNQPVIDLLYAASRALRNGDQAAAERALSPPVFPAGGPATLQRLAAFPLLPQANRATSFTAAELNRQDTQNMGRRGGNGGNRP